MIGKNKNKIHYNLLCLIVSFIIFSSMFSTSIAYIQRSSPPIQKVSLPPEIILDQKQEQHNNKQNIHSIIWMAQSFKPTKSPLVKIEVKLEKLRQIEYPIEIAIRDDLSNLDLISYQIPGNQLPYYANWIEFDIPDIDVEVNQTYYIILRSNNPSRKSFSWFSYYGEDIDNYPNGEQWFSNDYGGTWSKTSTERFAIDFTFRTYSYKSKEDLLCSGSFNWSEIKPGETVNGSFTIQNNGTPFSSLSWEIFNWPSWGTWTFSQKSGTNLQPENGIVRVYVSAEAPHSNIPDIYEGEIYIINKDNPDDYCKIEATMETPHPKFSFRFPSNILSEMIERFFTFFKN